MRSMIRRISAVVAAGALIFGGAFAGAQSGQGTERVAVSVKADSVVPSHDEPAACFTDVERFADGTGYVLYLSNDPRTDGLCPGVQQTERAITQGDALWHCESMLVVCPPVQAARKA